MKTPLIDPGHSPWMIEDASGVRFYPGPNCDIDHITLTWRRDLEEGEAAIVCPECRSRITKWCETEIDTIGSFVSGSERK